MPTSCAHLQHCCIRDQETCQLLKDLKSEIEQHQQKCSNRLLFCPDQDITAGEVEQSSAEIIIGQEFCLTSSQFYFRRPANKRSVMPLAVLLEQDMDPEPPPFSCFDALFSGLRSEPLQNDCKENLDSSVEDEGRFATDTKMLHDHDDDVKYYTTSALHMACTLPNSHTWIKQLCAKGAKVNEQNVQGQTPLHIVLLGDVKSDAKNIEESVKCLLDHGADVHIKDSEGETPLLYVRTMLEEGEFQLAEGIADALLKRGCNPNIRDQDGRTILTYTVSHLDRCESITRLLLNGGGCVWNSDHQNRTDVCMDNSSFVWFLKAIIRQRKFDDCGYETLELLSRVMAEQPQRMHAHVLRTMFKHVRCYRILGPVFLQIKMSMMKYWTRPHDLKFICSTTIRRKIGQRRISRSVPYLGGLPKMLRNYVLMK